MYKIFLNWKMYLSVVQSRNLAAQCFDWISEKEFGGELVIFPSDLAISDVNQQVHGSGIKIGGQFISPSKTYGAFTGQTFAEHLKVFNCEYAIVGHSEQRKYFNVSDEFVRAQVQACLEHEIIPVICVGETEDEKKEGRTKQVITRQLETIFDNLNYNLSEIIIAYEPRWAIGTGQSCDSDSANEIALMIDHLLPEGLVKSVLYGGSVDKSNIRNYLQESSISGVLIGGASSTAESLFAMLEQL